MDQSKRAFVVWAHEVCLTDPVPSTFWLSVQIHCRSFRRQRLFIPVCDESSKSRFHARDSARANTPPSVCDSNPQTVPPLACLIYVLLTCWTPCLVLLLQPTAQCTWWLMSKISTVFANGGVMEESKKA